VRGVGGIDQLEEGRKKKMERKKDPILNGGEGCAFLTLPLFLGALKLSCGGTSKQRRAEMRGLLAYIKTSNCLRKCRT
jgi:hypothetical protein